MFCSNCGFQNPEGSAYCGGCGGSLKSLQPQAAISNIQEVSSPMQKENISVVHLPESKKGFKFDKKVMIVGLTVIAVLFVTFFGFKILFAKDAEFAKIERIFDEKKPIKIEEDGLYGYIDTTGKVIVQPQYTVAGEFNGKYAIVQDEEQYYIIDRKGKVVLEPEGEYVTINYIEDYDVWVIAGTLYNGNLKAVTKEDISVRYEGSGYLSYSDYNKNESGLMTTKGKITASYSFTDGYASFSVSRVLATELKDVYAVVTIDSEKSHIINAKTGKKVYNETEDRITVSENNVFYTTSKNAYDVLEYFYIAGNKVAYTSDDSIRYVGENMLLLDEYDEYKLYDLKKKKVIDADVDGLFDIDDPTGYKLFNCDKGYGLMEGEKVILSCNWKGIVPLGDSLTKYLEKKTGKHLILLSNGETSTLYDLEKSKEVEIFNTRYVSTSGSSIFLQYNDDSTDETIVYNLKTGKKKDFSNDVRITRKTNYFIVEDSGTMDYYNTDFKLIYSQN